MKKYSLNIFITTLALTFSLGLSVWWVYLMISEVIVTLKEDHFEAFERVVFLAIGLSLMYGGIIYILTRLARLNREKTTVHPTHVELDTFYYSPPGKPAPPLTVLIPSYKEELRVVEMTLLSAALQEYPNKNVVLLVDDPVSYEDPEDQNLLNETLLLPKKIEAELRSVQAVAEKQYEAFAKRLVTETWDPQGEVNYLIETFTSQKEWYEARRVSFNPNNHTEHFFVDFKFDAGRDRIEKICQELRMFDDKSELVTKDLIDQYYKKAISTFNVQLSVFQRKRYENLSHEPNKAMNLNSYISLIGKQWKEVRRNGKCFLKETSSDADFSIRESAYLITLDADSVLSVSYARRLVYFMEQSEHERVAVVQTPYNTFRSPFVNLERIAGATTDIQHNVHQGFETYHASFWVGANALLRFSALNDIKEKDTEREHTIYRYVQDRTVIEDTESSIDLVVNGWEVHNYLEQLAYSATPPDFGSLIIQRRRWANGGIIIFPKLVSYLLFGKTPLKRRFIETFVRAHYLLSTAFVSVGVLVMILYPFDGELHIVPLVMVALLYFAMYASDLKQMGYSYLDLLRVYALNLLLIPVNVAGTFKSIQQLITKQKIPFGRTPKIAGRTAASIGFIAVEFGITGYMLFALFFDLSTGRIEHAIFSGINMAFFLYACVRLIGLRAAYEDVRAGLRWRR